MYERPTEKQLSDLLFYAGQKGYPGVDYAGRRWEGEEDWARLIGLIGYRDHFSIERQLAAAPVPHRDSFKEWEQEFDRRREQDHEDAREARRRELLDLLG
jgi:hypothetical protein